MERKKKTSKASGSKPATKKLVKLEQPVDSTSISTTGNSSNRVDLGRGIGEATAVAASAHGDTDEYVYRDPAPLKWRIFEAVAKTNGQRAFGLYWSALREFMRGWLPRCDLDEALKTSLGTDNVHLHNEMILCLLNNARCRHLPAELVSQVPASYRGKVAIHATVTPPPASAPLPAFSSPTALRAGSSASAVSRAPSSNDTAVSSSLARLPSNSSSSSSSSANASSPFQGKRTEGLLLLNAVKSEGAAIDKNNAAAAAVGGGNPPTDEKEKPGGTNSTAVPAPLPLSAIKLEADSGGKSQASPASFQGGKSRRDDDRIHPAAAATAAVETPTPTKRSRTATVVVAEEDRVLLAAEQAQLSAEQAQLLEDAIECHFGAGSDLWRPWSSPEVEGGGWGTPGRTEPRRGPQLLLPLRSSPGKKRSLSASSESSSSPTGGCNQQQQCFERTYKALKSEGGTTAGSPAAANRGCVYNPGAAAAAAAKAAAEQLSPSHRAQRVPGARALAPFLQACTASQQMKVSHEVCRVMTAGVKEYLRRIMEACLVNAKGGQRGGLEDAARGAGAARGTPSTGGDPCRATASNGTTPPPPPSQPAAAAVAAAAAKSGGVRRIVLTPGHLQTALETTPRLVGPPSAARTQWRRVATYAGEHRTVTGRAGRSEPSL